MRDKLKDIEDKYLYVALTTHEYKKNIVVSKLVVDILHRNEGIGTRVMNDIIKYANDHNKNILLTPSAEYGGSLRKLKKWYSKLGFKKNKKVKTIEQLIKTPNKVQ